MTFGHDSFGRNAFNASVGLTKPIKRAETQTFAAEANGTGLANIASGDSLFTIWASSTKSDEVFKDTKTFSCNDGKCTPNTPGSVAKAKKALQNYSAIATQKISLYDDAGQTKWGSKVTAVDGSALIGAARVAPKAGVKMTWDILTVNCDKAHEAVELLVSGGGTKLRDGKGKWGTQQPNAVGSANFNSSWNSGNNRAVRVTLDGDKGDYIEVDMDKGAMSSKNFAAQVDGVYYGTSKALDDVCGDDIRVDLYFRGVAALPKEGCMDTDASNTCTDCNVEDNSKCTYPATSITSFTPNKTKGKPGDSVVLNWKINSPSQAKSIKIEKESGGATDVTFPKTVTDNGNDSSLGVILKNAGTYKFKITAVGAGNKSGQKTTSGVTITVPSPTDVLGCMDSTATNYNSAANQDDGSCYVGGCMDETATNYDANATQDDGSCIAARY